MPQYFCLPVLPSCLSASCSSSAPHPSRICYLDSNSFTPCFQQCDDKLRVCGEIHVESQILHHVLLLGRNVVRMISSFHRFVGELPFCRLVPELQHPAAGRGLWAAVRGRQRSSVRAQHHQHLHSRGPQGESADGSSMAPFICLFISFIKPS